MRVSPRQKASTIPPDSPQFFAGWRVLSVWWLLGCKYARGFVLICYVFSSR